MNAKKIATSLPAEQFAALERARKRLKLKRSEAVQEALSMWLSARMGDERIASYVRGYTAHPDDAKGAESLARAWVQGLEDEGW